MKQIFSAVDSKEGWTGWKNYFSSVYHAEIEVHGESCLDSLEYFSSKKLVCRTGSAVGPGKIIVTTLSGGDGSCTVSFCGLAPAQPTLLGWLGTFTRHGVVDGYNPCCFGGKIRFCSMQSYQTESRTEVWG